MAHISRRAPLPARELFSPLSAVLVSHAHRDHLDLPSLKALDVEGPVLVPRGCGRLVGRALPAATVHELEAGDRVTLGAVDVVATHAEHDGRRIPLGRHMPSLGFVVEGPSRLYFAGDTDLFPGMGELGRLDVALLPVWGWGKRLPRGHLTPERAARAAALIRPERAVPIHWGTYAAPRAWLPEPDRPARRFEELVSEGGSGVAVSVLEPGDQLALSG